MLARDQLNNKSRRVMPALMACVISHEDEFSRPLVRTIGTLTQYYRNLIKTEPHLLETGEKLGKKTSSFRTSLKDALMCANANGFGKALACAGKPNPMFFRRANFPGPLAPPFQLPSTPVQGLNATISDIDMRNIAIQSDPRYSIMSPLAAPFAPSVAPGVALPFSQRVEILFEPVTLRFHTCHRHILYFLTYLLFNSHLHCYLPFFFFILSSFLSLCTCDILLLLVFFYFSCIYLFNYVSVDLYFLSLR